MNDTTFTDKEWSKATELELRCGYEAMATDDDRENEATEWNEGLIGDCL